MELTDAERETILAYAKCDMNVSATSEAVFTSRNAVDYRLQRIKEKIGLDPKCFYDLVKLVDMCH